MSGKEIQVFAEQGVAKRYTLVRETDAGGQVVCRSLPDEGADAVAARFWGRIEAYQSDQHGAQRFVVIAAGEDGKVIDTLPVTVDGDDMELLQPLSGLQPTMPTSALKASLKASKDLHDSTRKLMADLHRDYRRQLAAKDKRIGDLEGQLDKAWAQRVEVVETLEALKTQAHDRRLKHIAAEGEAKAQEWMLDRLANYMPLVVGALTGSTPLAKLAKSLDEEQMAKLAAVLEPEQLQGLMEIFKLGDQALAAEGNIVRAPD